MQLLKWAKLSDERGKRETNKDRHVLTLLTLWFFVTSDKVHNSGVKSNPTDALDNFVLLHSHTRKHTHAQVAYTQTHPHTHTHAHTRTHALKRESRDKFSLLTNPVNHTTKILRKEINRAEAQFSSVWFKITNSVLFKFLCVWSLK